MGCVQRVVLFYLGSGMLKSTHELCYVDAHSWVSCQIDFSGFVFILLKAKGPEIVL